MQICRVVGTVVSTQKHRKFEGAKLLLVQPVNPASNPPLVIKSARAAAVGMTANAANIMRNFRIPLS